MSVLPPASRTFPSDKSVAVCWLRATFMFPKDEKLKVEGSNSSAVCNVREPVTPPATKRSPLNSMVAVQPDLFSLR